MTHGMVCAPQPEAVEAGALALRNGGNAVDAAIVCALVQTAVDPQMCGIAGFGSLHLYLPGRGVHRCFDFHGRAPAKARPEMWADLIEWEAEDGFGFKLSGQVNDLGYQAITTPGSLKAYHEALSRYGTLDWKDALAPAIGYAEDGFMIRPHVHEFWTRKEAFGLVDHIERLRFSASGRRIYFDDSGALRQPGTILKNPDMARTLGRIAEDGIEVFYRGEIAQTIAADMERGGGLLTLEDLGGTATEDNEPLWGEYRGHRIATNPPPGGGIMVLEMLHILEHFDLEALGHNSADYIRIVSEAMKRATLDKDRLVGDPKFVDVPVERLLSREYAREQAEAIERGEVAHVPRYGAKPEPAKPEPAKPEPKDTTHVSVVDADGNAVSMTHSLGMPSGVITDGLGFMYNGCMAVFDPRPGRTGSIAPGKARFTSMAPTIVFSGETPRLVLGAPGGTFIAMGILQTILNAIDFAMTPAEAVAAPRFCATSDVIDVTNRIPRFVQAKLEARGYQVRRSHRSHHFAGVHAIGIKDGQWQGGADPGRDGMALEV
ncbi:MAG: gamma-glutamyltransferase [Proteobacteria bacterium]|nr:gamma-glutamyltransferase [Pseudomonadota bacterium]